MKIEEATLRRMWPRGDTRIRGLIAGIASTSEAVFARYGIATPLEAAHVMAQLSEECGAGTEVVENLSYTAGRMMEIWPGRFPTLASALPYQRNPQKLAIKVYGGRMGNRPGTDDGWTYRGRGGSQTTGRSAYARLGETFGVDLLANPDLLLDPKYFFGFAVCDFVQLCNCLPFCRPKPGLPFGDIVGVTHHLNGGLTGLSSRKVWFRKWCDALGVNAKPAARPVSLLSVPDAPQGAANEADYADDGVLRYGDQNSPTKVKALQGLLRSKGYFVGRIDGDFSGGLRAAVRAAKDDNGMDGTPEVTDEDIAAFEAMPNKPIAEARESATEDDLREAGSKTIFHADKVKMIGRGLAALGIGKAADGAGALDGVKDSIDQVQTFRGIVDSAGDLATWAASHWWIGAICLGAAAYYFGQKIVAQRLADHRSGANMSR